MVQQAEQQVRRAIDKSLTAAGWQVCDPDQVNIHADRGVAMREFPLRTGDGAADCLLYIDGKAAGVIETEPRLDLARCGKKSNSDQRSQHADLAGVALDSLDRPHDNG